MIILWINKEWLKIALIKCEDCGKEFSDKANACPNCGCPYEKEIKESKMKKYDDLTQEEKVKVNQYRISSHQWWTESRIGVLIVGVIGLIFVIIFFITFAMYYLIIAILLWVIESVLSRSSIKEQKIWYEAHKEEVYKNKYL